MPCIASDMSLFVSPWQKAVGDRNGELACSSAFAAAVASMAATARSRTAACSRSDACVSAAACSLIVSPAACVAALS